MIFRYKCRFITFVLLLGYAYLHLSLTGLLSEFSYADLMNFSVRLPFAQRLLLPAMAHWSAKLLPLAPEELFFLMEWLFISLFYFALQRLLKEEFSASQAQLLSWLAILVLPLVTVVNYRFQSQGTAPIFYPSDTASLFFMVMGFSFCLRAEWRYFIPWVFLATLNRESSVLLVLMVPALHWQKPKLMAKPLLLALLTYIAARIMIFSFLTGTPGQVVEWYLPSGDTHFQDNLIWLLNGQSIFLFVFCIAGLPLLWFAFYDYIPERYRPLRYVALFYFIGLLMVGRFIEARIFSEIFALLYFPVCVAVRNWLGGFEPIYPVSPGLGYYVGRYFVLAALVLTLILRGPLNQLLVSVL